MKSIPCLAYTLAVFILLAGNTFAQKFLARKVTDNILIVSADEAEENQVGGNQIVIISGKGLVVFNTFWSQNTAREFKQAIMDALNRDDFKYTINMVDRLDMFGGNAAYPETMIIGHKSFVDKYKGREEEVKAEIQQLIDMWRWKEGVSRERLKEYAEGSEDALSEQRWANSCKRRAEDLEQGFSLVLPDITYDDRMTLDLGNITLKLNWFGRAGNYNGMTVAVIPEEKVAIIPSFIIHPQHLAPYPYNEYVELDVPRWLAVLEELLEGENAVDVVICGIEEVWSRQQAQPYLDYMRRLWNAVMMAEREGKDLSEVQDQLSLEKEFAFVKELAIYKNSGDDWVRPQHQMHVRLFYLQNKNMASELIRKGGVDSLRTSLETIRKLRAGNSDIYFDEASFNDLGYYLMNLGKIPEAIEVFRLNVEVFPESANVYDSLGEAYMKSGDKENAIRNYQKSLALNPNNENAKNMLQQLGQN